MAAAKPSELLMFLPPDAFPIRHEWVRFYDRKEMAHSIEEIREFLLSRQSLLGLVSICEAAVFRLNERLADLDKCARISGIKKLLGWAFQIVRNIPEASSEAASRLPTTCGDLDNARRLRNCIVHRNGCYDEKMYFHDNVDDGWVNPQYERDSRQSAERREPIFLTTGRFEYITRSHIEFLHILHDTIQAKEFGHSVGYNYAEEGKQIEWHRILSGRRDLAM